MLNNTQQTIVVRQLLRQNAGDYGHNIIQYHTYKYYYHKLTRCSAIAERTRYI